MKKSKFGRRVIAFVLVFVMVVTLLPLSTISAAINEIATGTKLGDTGIDNSSLGKEGTINWPVKIYDYLADGMLFEYSSNNGAEIVCDPAYDYGGGNYVYGKPMPTCSVYSTDYTTDAAYNTNAYVTQYNTNKRGVRYVPTAVSAVNDSSPRYLKLKINPSAYSGSNRNFYVSNFRNDDGVNVAPATIRYMVMVYRSSGINTTTKADYFGTSMAPMSFLINSVTNTTTTTESSSWLRYDVTSWTNSSEWTYRVFDLYSLGFTSNYTNGLSITPNFNSTSAYLDLSHVGYFTTSAAATEYGKNCVEFNKDPGQYLPNATNWNGGNNLGFGMLLPSSGGSWTTGGGSSSANNGYHTHRVGYSPYTTGTGTYSATFNNNRKDINGNAIGNNNIYFITSTYASNSAFGYQSKLANDSDPNNDNDYLKGYNTNDLKLDGYNLLTYVTQGLMTIGLLEGTLNEDGTPQYRQEAVEYIAQMLYNSLVIPQKDSSGKYNYNYVTGNKSTQYGTDANGNALDLAQALRNCLGITFSSGANKGYFPASTSTRTYGYGSYAGTLTRANNSIGLKGKFLDVKSNIHTCMDAAYYLLNNIFVENSYNQVQSDYKYLTLSSAKLNSGETAFVFDGGYSVGADPAKLENGTLTQDQYIAQTKSAVEYSSLKNGGDGSISMGPVQAKDMYYYSGSSTTTRFPFLPITGATGDYAGETRHYYFAEDGYRSYNNEFGTYVNRNYNYVLESNGEFVFHEEDELFFEFEGDDDVYLFINGQLALDLGGAHSISNVRFDVNDYVYWARDVLKDPDSHTDAEIARAQALNLEDGEVASFDFFYMERHGYGANMRIVTNMHITDPDLRVEKTAYQGGKQIEYGGIVDADDPIEYNFKLTNAGNTKLYNLTFADDNIGVYLTYSDGLYVKGDGNDTDVDDVNGYFVTDARGERLDAEDLTAIVTGYENVGSGGDYIKDGHTYTKVESGKGTHTYHDGLVINFEDNEALKRFLTTLQSDKTDNETVDEELTQKGSGLWVDAEVTFKGIYYTMNKNQEEAGMFDNTVNVTATQRLDTSDPTNVPLISEARHRVYVTAIPSYYQWAGHDLFISKKRVLDDASAEAGNENSMLHDYISFFNKVNGDISKYGTQFCDRMGNVVGDSYYGSVSIKQAKDGNWGYVANYPESGIYEFFLLMYMYGASGLPSDLSTLKASDLNLGDYAIVRVLVIVADAQDSEYVLDYGLSTENLDANGELFKNDELFGALSGTQALLMGVTDKEPSYRNFDAVTDYNRINFEAQDLSVNNKIQTEDGYYNVNLVVPEEGKTINYDEFSGMYTLTESGTVMVHVDCPAAWEEMYLYYWYDDKRDNVWPGELMEMTSHGNFELAIPGNVPHIIISKGSEHKPQTIDIDIEPGREVWVTINGEDFSADGKLVPKIEYKTSDGIVHAKVPEGWGDVYFHSWDTLGNPVVAWPGTKGEAPDEDGFYTFAVPGDITDVLINNGDKGKQTENLKIYPGSETWITVGDKTTGTNDTGDVTYYAATVSRSTETVTVHASVPSDWAGAFLYYWNSNGSATGVDWPGLAMTKGDDGMYHIDNIPADVTNVIINDGQKSNGEQTRNLSITPGIEAWITVSSHEDSTETKVEVTVPSDWGSANVYFFKGDTAVGTAWPGKAATLVSGNTYTIDAPAGATHFIVNNNNNGKQTQNILLNHGEINKINAENYNATSADATELLISVPKTWRNVNVYYWYENGSDKRENEGGWPGVAATMELDGTYKATIPAGFNKFIINNGINQTADITDFYMGATNVVAVYDDLGVKVSYDYKVDIVYGENAEKEGFTFTPTDFMDSAYSLWLALTVHENKVDDDDEVDVTENQATPLGNPINIGKEVQMYKKVTVLPASVVYYEDDFAGIKYNSNTTNIFTHYGEGSGSLSQQVDQNQEYGQDSVYQGSENDEITGGSLTKLEVKDNVEFASFEFTGTGFEIIGHTHATESASMRVVVKDSSGKVVSEKIVITEFDQNGDDKGTESIESVPLIRFSGLEFGKYTVSINGVPVYDWSQWDGDRAHKPPTKKTCICVDGVRIYQPLNNSDSKGGNLALGQKCDAVAYPNSPYTANLTDGKAETSLQNSNWFGFKNTGDSATGNIDPNNNNRAVFTLSLECEAKVSSVRVHHYKGTNAAGIGTFGYINVYYSTDGSNFSYIETINPDPSKTASYWATLDISSAPVNAKYIKFALGGGEGTLALINEIEVYGTEVPTPGRNDAYLDTENGASFTEIRNLVAERQAFAIKYDDISGLSVSGGTNTWIENRNNVVPTDRGKTWTNNTVNSVADYLLAGPNNELYMIESTDEEKSAIAFYVTEDDSLNVHNMQIAMRGIDYGAFMGSEQTGLFNAEIQYGALVDDELVWKPLTTLRSSAEQYFTIPYTECPYDEVNDRYQVVLRVADTDVTGMASFTTIKLKGLELNTLNTSEVPDVPEITYEDEINNTIIDNNGNTLATSKFVDFLKLGTQMQSEVVVASEDNDTLAIVEGVNTSALGVLYDSFTADDSSDFVLTENSKIFIVTETETKPSAEVIETAQLVQSQFAADKLPTSNPMDIVWGLEKYAAKGDIIIYANASGYGTEEFKLVVTDRAKVYAADDNGLLYGLNTLHKHFRNAGSNALEGFTIQDKPDTKERAVHLDCARKYLTPEYIKNFIAEMSWMGYNALELHMSEDGGFRMDFWGDAALSQVPGMSGNDFSWVCGSNPAPWVYEQFQDTADKGKYLTTEEVISICQVAKEYNIEIIPSFDTPAHVGYMTELYYNTVEANPNSSIRNFTYNGTEYTLPTQINYREYDPNSSTKNSRYNFSVLNLKDTAVKNFAYAMYNDIAAFFKYYAGSTDFNIGADEVALTSTDVWTYSDFVSYVNQVNAVLKAKGYTTRMYNDFVYNTKYTTATTGIDNDIEIVYWDAPSITTSSTTENIRRASFFHTTQGRTVYSGVQNWTYYVLRIAPTSTATHMDARDPDNRQWTFYRNQEDLTYNEWDPTRLSEYTITYSGLKHGHYSDYYSGENLGGGYFMVWNDFAGLNTEVETWNGCKDVYGKYSNGTYSGYGYDYSLIERMWSNAAKQWNWDVNSTVTFAKYETLRDSMGFFPGYVATPSTQAYANGFVLPEPTAVSDEAYRTSYTVTFKNYDGRVLDTQQVRDNTAATAPEDPTRPSDVWYDYTFAGWDTDFSSITADTVITATYSQSATTAGKIGYLEVMVSGGTNFNMSFGENDMKPMGTKYVNPSMDFGVKVTVSAETTNGNRFIGWMDAKSGDMLTTSLTHTFYTSGNEVLVALFDTDLEGKGTVTFRNDKTSQILDIQYYSSTDTIKFPENAVCPGYEFAGWSLSEEEIKAKLSEGKDVTVIPVWNVKDVYFSITVKGGTVTHSEGQYEGKYVGYKGTTITANNTPAGKIFAYWADEAGNVLSYEKQFKFYPYKDTVITAHYISSTVPVVDIVGTMEEEVQAQSETADTFKVYFENNWLWTEVYIYYWGVDGEPAWRGVPMNFLENNGTYDVYTYDVPTGIKGMIINGIKNDGSGETDKTPDITEFVDGRQYSMTWNDGNAVIINDSRVESSGGNEGDGGNEGGAETETEYNTIYLYVSSDWKSDDAWFAAYTWNPDDESDNMWVKLTNVNGNVYTAQIPAKYSNFLFARMNPASTDMNWDNRWNQTGNLTVSPTDEKNMYILNPGWEGTGSVGNMNTVYFVNEFNWETVTVTYTDANGTYKVEAVLAEEDENGNEIFSMLIPENVQKITFSNGTEEYVYTANSLIADKSIFGFVIKDNSVKYDIAISVGMDTTSTANSNTVVFSWEVPEETGYTFVNAGLLLVREEDYDASTFVTGTISSDVIQFVPAKKYQTSTGAHSVTIPQVKTGEAWIACSFVQYRDEYGVLRTKYSKQVTGKK